MAVWTCHNCNTPMNAVRKAKHKCLTDREISSMVATHERNSAEDAGIRLRQRGKDKETLSKYTVRNTI